MYEEQAVTPYNDELDVRITGTCLIQRVTLCTGLEPEPSPGFSWGEEWPGASALSPERRIQKAREEGRYRPSTQS
jgi:hypothetical protein